MTQDARCSSVWWRFSCTRSLGHGGLHRDTTPGSLAEWNDVGSGDQFRGIDDVADPHHRRTSGTGRSVSSG